MVTSCVSILNISQWHITGATAFYQLRQIFLSATSTHFNWELMLYCFTLSDWIKLSYSYSYSRQYRTSKDMFNWMYLSNTLLEACQLHCVPDNTVCHTLTDMVVIYTHATTAQGGSDGQAPLIARFMGTIWGPSGADRTQVGPMLAPWTLLSGSFYKPPELSLGLNRFYENHWTWTASAKLLNRINADAYVIHLGIQRSPEHINGSPLESMNYSEYRKMNFASIGDGHLKQSSVVQRVISEATTTPHLFWLQSLI